MSERGGGQGRRMGKGLINAALEADVRHLGLEKWCEMVDCDIRLMLLAPQALLLAECGL